MRFSYNPLKTERPRSYRGPAISNATKWAASLPPVQHCFPLPVGRRNHPGRSRHVAGRQGLDPGSERSQRLPTSHPPLPGSTRPLPKSQRILAKPTAIRHRHAVTTRSPKAGCNRDRPPPTGHTISTIASTSTTADPTNTNPPGTRTDPTPDQDRNIPSITSTSHLSVEGRGCAPPQPGITTASPAQPAPNMDYSMPSTPKER